MKRFLALEEESTPVPEIGYDPESNVSSALLETQEASVEADQSVDELDESSETANALDDIAQAIEGTLPDGGLSEPVAQALTTAVEHMCARLGYSNRRMPALESFSAGNLKVATEEAMQSIRTTAKAVWDAIVKAFKRIGVFFKELFDKIFSAKEKNKQRAKDLDKDLSDLEKDVGNPSTKEADVQAEMAKKAPKTTAAQPTPSAAKLEQSKPVPAQDTEVQGPQPLMVNGYMCLENKRLADYFGAHFAYNHVADKLKGVTDAIYNEIKPIDRLIQHTILVSRGQPTKATEDYLKILSKYDIGTPGQAAGVTKVTQFPFGGRIVWSKDNTEGDESRLKVAFERKLDQSDQDGVSTLQVCPIREGLQLIELCQLVINNPGLSILTQTANKKLAEFIEMQEEILSINEKSIKRSEDPSRKSNYDEEDIAEMKKELSETPIMLRRVRDSFSTWLQLLSILAQYETTLTSAILDWVDASAKEIKKCFPDRK